jgi:hypothetical protein
MVGPVLALSLLAGCAETGTVAEPNATIQATVEPDEPVADPTEPPTDFEDILLKGKGTKVAKFTVPEGTPAIAKISCKCRSNFAIWTVGPDGSQGDLLVNVIGSYAGTVLFSEYGEEVVAFQVEADAAWSILVRPVIRAPAWNRSEPLTGEGDAVYRLTPPSSGLTTVTLNHKGEGNFAIWGYSDATTDLLVNEIDAYRGETLLSEGTFLLEISAGGNWSIAPG